MRRITSVLIFALAGLALALAQKPAQVLDKAVAVIDGAGGVTANYALTSSHGNSNGTFAMSGEKFRVLSPEVKCWFNGNDQWAYSPTTGEVNITTPTARELQMTNPLAAARAFKKGCKLSKAKRQAPGMHTIVLIPNERGDVKGITLDIDRNTYLLRTAVFVMNNGQHFAITLTNYKTGVALPASTFTYDPSQVPAGTEVVDLR